MEPIRRRLLLLGAATFLLGACSGSSSHFLQYFYTAVSQPSQGLPEFVGMGYLDGQPIDHYDSNTRRKVPAVSWMKQAEREYADLWSNPRRRNSELQFKHDLANLQKHYNQSEGFHTWQEMYSCELRKDGSKIGYDQYGFDGRDFISFDKETLTWTAADVGAQIIKRKWDADLAQSQYFKVYYEKDCVEWLQKFLEYGKEVVLRTELPTVKVMRKAETDGMETLVCRAYGFYPKEINATWRKDGEVWRKDTFRTHVTPNSDGTYHTWLGIKIDPKERDCYQCHVEHDSLLEPLDVAWEESASHVGLIIGCTVGAVLLLVTLTAGFSVYIKKRQDGYKAASASDQGSVSSGRGSNTAI